MSGNVRSVTASGIGLQDGGRRDGVPGVHPGRQPGGSHTAALAETAGIPTHRYLTDLGDQTTSGQWRDGDALFLRCTVGREVAEHVGESLTRGGVVVQCARRYQL